MDGLEWPAVGGRHTSNEAPIRAKAAVGRIVRDLEGRRMRCFLHTGCAVAILLALLLTGKAGPLAKSLPDWAEPVEPQKTEDLPDWATPRDPQQQKSPPTAPRSKVADEQKRREAVALEKLNRVGLQGMNREDLDNLPVEASKKLPVIEAMAKAVSDGSDPLVMRRALTMQIQLELHDLKFYGEVPTGEPSEKFVDAVKEFQKSIHAKPTGELLVREWDELEKRCALAHPPEVLVLHDVRVDVWADMDLCFIDGTRVFSDGTEFTSPVQTSRIELNRRTKSGIEAIARILMVQNEAAESYLHVDIVHWEILRWDDNEIVAEHSGSVSSSTMTVDIKAKKVHVFERPKDSEEKPQILELTNGWKVSQQFWEKRREEALQMMAPAFREAWKTLKESLKPTTKQSDHNKP